MTQTNRNPQPPLAPVAVIGAGLAGCECALALAGRGIACTLFEMKPRRFSPAHEQAGLAELVCSNSLRSDDPKSAVGQLKNELRAMGSAVMRAAEATRVPAGKALAVDRALFSRHMTAQVEAEPLISLERREITALTPAPASPDEPALQGFSHMVVAAGPLASEALVASLLKLLAPLGGKQDLYFYDAIAPIIAGDSLNRDIIFQGSRYDEGEGDYLNCPMNRDEYFAFYNALMAAAKAPAKDFEQEKHFEGCMPIEALAERGERTLVFGPFKPVGFTDPRTGGRPFAIVQLRAENLNRSMFNLVGCQTKLLHKEQERVFRMIPGLENAEFARFGSMHRNTFVNAPQALNPDLSLKAAPRIFLAGQITGVEGYVESSACGLWLGLSLAARIQGAPLPPPPPESALGALLRHLQTPAKNFQPSNIQFGLMPELGEPARKADRKLQYAQRAQRAFRAWLESCRLENREA
ncbi:MAG: methylenetetrahydrofolate--tRNA-(uracil(54)-C(5))-methyltransferase (FADH(2)-oxidizing) TrmFO [Deltaproteobacteria bacterium]|jgi:methylenetetrahydrofolate--tRNA-(uracil-5-)-methyltransferase|nr:methylenetetrahydrofolate--tRNA-(uracil(54)-C(5))-methyltransferase (FADH(2)-oxidizing) TrmFO [Deltaproteobacteria bacterium]